MTSTSMRARIVRQFRRPTGWAGRVAGWILAHRPSNRKRNLRTLELLDIHPQDHILEVGFGPGLAIAWAAERVREGRVVGLDHSVCMHRAASRRNARAIAAGRVQLHVGDAAAPPPLGGPFDKIFGVNVWMFWPDPVDTVRSFASKLTPDGVLALTYLPRHRNASNEDTRSGGESLTRILRRQASIG